MERMPGRMALNLFLAAISIGTLLDFSTISLNFRLIGTIVLAVVALLAIFRVWMAFAARSEAKQDRANGLVETPKWRW